MTEIAAKLEAVDKRAAELKQHIEDVARDFHVGREE